MPASRLDAIYRRMLVTKFFTKGWGKPENLERIFEFRRILSDRDNCFKLIPKDYPVNITKEEVWPDCRVLEGNFLSPMARFLPGVVPDVVKDAHFQVMVPHNWREKNFKPMCLHLAGTGDHYFWRRRNIMAKPLMREGGIGSIILENPFYGLRKPKDQVRSCLHNVTDIFVMGGCLILESLVLFHWCERNGLGPLGVTGLSMGGHMASLAATNWPKPLVLVPCLSWSTASSVFTRGVLSNSINWDLLETQYFSDGAYRDKLSKMVTIVDDAYLAGKRFFLNFNKSITELKSDIKQVENDITDTSQLRLSAIRNNDKKNVTGIKRKIQKTLNENNTISKNLMTKITSDKNYELNAQEINELNSTKDGQIQKQKHENIAVNAPKKSHLLAQITKSESNTSINIPAPLLNNISQTEIKPENDSNTTDQNDVIINKNKPTISDKINESTPDLYSKKSENSLTNDTSFSAVPVSETVKLKSYFNFLHNLKGEKTDNGNKKLDLRDREALQFMRGIMDECTHLSNFSVPFDTSLIIAVCAKDDAYVPRENCGNLEEIWPGSEVRYVNAGHVSAYVLHQGLFRSCIIEAFERSKTKWINP